MRKRNGWVLAGFVAAAVPAHAADFNDPTWPCVQRKVEEIAMFQMWPGPMPEGDWQDDPEIERVATNIAPRRVSMEEVEERVAA